MLSLNVRGAGRDAWKREKNEHPVSSSSKRRRVEGKTLERCTRNEKLAHVPRGTKIQKGKTLTTWIRQSFEKG